MAMTFQKNIGLLILGIWLILNGLVGTTGVLLPAVAMPALALMAGVLIVAGR